jgi:hypothetical protein
MPRKTKSTKRKRKSPEFEGIKSMEKTMKATTRMVGNVAIAGMGMALAGAVIGGMGK